MDYFLYRGNDLYAEDVPVAQIAEQFGTPCYIYSQQTLERHWNAMEAVFAKQPHRICYAVKANGNLALLKLLAQLGAGFDIVSGGELARVIASGADPQKIVFSGVGKTTTEIQQALAVGIGVFNVESLPEIHRINEIAASMGKVAAVAVRINPDINAHTHPYISTGLAHNKFGIDKNEVIAVYKTIQQLPAVKAVGMACHIGSQILELTPFAEALSCVLQLVTALKKENIILQHVDVGGGLGVCYDKETPPSLEEYATTLYTTLQQQAPYPLELWLEPGRVLIANAAILVSKVEYLKETAAKTFAILDAGMTDLVRPALYDAHHKIIAVKKLLQKEIEVDLVGPVCESSDFLGKSRLLAINPGDLIAVRSVGAYGFSMGSHYNARPRCAEILVYKDDVQLIRRRETIDDLLSHEQKQPFVKMQALGNDFVLLDLDENPEVWSSEKIKKLSHRHTGIGFDQLLTVRRKGDNQFYYGIYNADGGEVEQCGNGARAVALYLTLKNKIDPNKELQLLTCNRAMMVKRKGANRFTVDMGKPDFSPAAIPLELPLQENYEIVIANQTQRFSALSMGNPHAVLRVDSIEQAPVQTVGKALCLHSYFPRETNVGFMQIIDKHRLALRVYERGVGETLACGSGACAAAVIAIRDGSCQSPVTVQLTGGELNIHWQGENAPVWMEGDAQCVYEGSVSS